MQQDSARIDDVHDFVSQCRTRLQRILNRLDWSEEGVLKNFNSNSVASTSSQKPKKICPFKINTYPESIITKNSITIETPQLQKLLQNDQIEAPQNFCDLQTNFSREQKLKIYEHVINHTEKLENNTVSKADDGQISLAEIVAQKKREQKHRKRKFRISKPTHIEEVRSLVDLQMQALLQFMGNQKEKVEDLHWKHDRKISYSHNKISSHGDRHRNDREGIAKDKGRYRNSSKERVNECRSRSKDRTKESRRRSRNRSKEIRRRSRSRSYNHRKRSRSREWSHDHYRKSNISTRKERKSYYKKQSRSLSSKSKNESINRRQSKSPQTTSSKEDQCKDLHQSKRSSHNHQSKNSPRKDRAEEYKKSEDISSYRKRSENKDIGRRKHKRKKHKKDRS